MPDVTVPRLAPTMEYGVLVEWSVSDGSRVERGEILGVLEADKVDVELEAPVGGIISLVAKAGEEYPVGAVLASIE